MINYSLMIVPLPDVSQTSFPSCLLFLYDSFLDAFVHIHEN